MHDFRWKSGDYKIIRQRSVCYILWRIVSLLIDSLPIPDKFWM